MFEKDEKTTLTLLLFRGFYAILEIRKERGTNGYCTNESCEHA